MKMHILIIKYFWFRCYNEHKVWYNFMIGQLVTQSYSVPSLTPLETKQRIKQAMGTLRIHYFAII